MQRKRVGVGRTAEVLAWGDGLFLKLFYEGFPARLAEAEATATRSVHEKGLPVPRVEGLTEVEGRSGIIFQRVDGPSMLAHVSRPPWPVTRMAHLLADLHARMHTLRVGELPPLHAVLEERIRSAPGLSAEEKEGTLEALAPLPGGEGVCHMDFTPTTSSCPRTAPSSSTGWMLTVANPWRMWPGPLSFSKWASPHRAGEVVG